ncbi:MAG TPA: ABC transporter substrate binding protein [Burkholderiales bacterium]
MLGAEPVVVLLSKAGGAYEEVAAALRSELRGETVTVELLADADKLNAKRPRAVAAIGTEACRTAAQAKLGVPLLCALIPHIAFDAIARSAKAPALSAVVLDQPLSRQMSLIRLLLPDARAVGVIFGPDSASLRDSIGDAALKRGMQVRGVHVADSAVLFPALKAVLDTDVLLAVPDGAVYNGATAQNVLRTAFEARVPLVAFSASYVRAGALAAVYSTPAQVGSQAGRSLAAVLNGTQIRQIQWPSEFEVSVNDQVARALGLDLEEAGRITERLRTLELAR